jgi:DNA-binding response OmpR family regulator
MMPPESTVRPESVLIVEDDATLLDVLSIQLREAGLNVVTAASSGEACGLLERDKFSLVLLDWNLSAKKTGSEEDLTGKTVLKFCRAIAPLMPVIVMSGETAFDVRTDAVSNEADSFLAKPFSMNLLVAHVSRWLKRQESTNQPSTKQPDLDDELIDLVFLK